MSKGIVAVNEFRNNKPLSMTKRVSIRYADGRLSVLSARIEISNCYRVNIIWLDSDGEDMEPDEYHDLGLFGYYDADYCNISYENGRLEIVGTNAHTISISK